MSLNLEKKQVALISVFAAILLTSFKLIIGITTGSLGILSEALHSGLDLVAALVTFLAVRISDKPADHDHNYGHGKVENLSALFETLLLLLTCFWIIYESANRLITGAVEIKVNAWSFIVVITSITIDYWRSRALFKAAKKFNSQALHADALHFSTDIWSSTVVLFGLIFSRFGFFHADAIAALIVAIIVIYVSFQLGKNSIDVLLDKSPENRLPEIEKIVKTMPEVLYHHDVKIRTAGADIFIDLNIHVERNITVEDAHDIAERLKDAISGSIARSHVMVHIEPDNDPQR
jgi:cation diffusion facilitator family transporter